MSEIKINLETYYKGCMELFLSFDGEDGSEEMTLEVIDCVDAFFLSNSNFRNKQLFYSFLIEDYLTNDRRECLDDPKKKYNILWVNMLNDLTGRRMIYRYFKEKSIYFNRTNDCERIFEALEVLLMMLSKHTKVLYETHPYLLQHVKILLEVIDDLIKLNTEPEMEELDENEMLES